MYRSDADLERAEAAHLRAMAASERARAARDRTLQMREHFEALQESAQQRESYADERDRLAVERERMADEREAEADQRDRLADERDRLADARQAEADRRERMADERETHADESEYLARSRNAPVHEGGGSIGPKPASWYRTDRMTSRSGRTHGASQDADEELWGEPSPEEFLDLGDELRMQGAALAEQIAQQAEALADQLELGARRGDRERRGTLADTEREVARVARRNAAKLRDRKKAFSGAEHLPAWPMA